MAPAPIDRQAHQRRSQSHGGPILARSTSRTTATAARMPSTRCNRAAVIDSNHRHCGVIHDGHPRAATGLQTYCRHSAFAWVVDIGLSA